MCSGTGVDLVSVLTTRTAGPVETPRECGGGQAEPVTGADVVVRVHKQHRVVVLRPRIQRAERITSGAL